MSSTQISKTSYSCLGLGIFLHVLGLFCSANAQQGRLPACSSNLSVDRWHNCFGTYTFSNGQKYVGEFRNGKRGGIGTTTYPSGQTHVGEYKNNIRDGKGTSSWPSGQKYEGEFKDDKYDGQGTLTYSNGAQFIGSFSDNKRNGRGILYAANGSVYEQGIWSEDKFQHQANASPSGTPQQRTLPNCPSDRTALWHNCFGTLTNAVGEKYVGEFRDGKRHGRGILYGTSGGMLFMGVWENDKYLRAVDVEAALLGRPATTSTVPSAADSAKPIIAEWAKDYRTGCRVWNPSPKPGETVTWSGECSNGFASGDGIVQWFIDGKISDRFEGTLQNGMRNGSGKYFSSNGTIYIGEFVSDKRQGQATYIWPNGDKYIGEYKGDKRHGKGILYSSNGAILQRGEWVDGNFVNPVDSNSSSQVPSSPRASSNNVPTSANPIKSGLPPCPSDQNIRFHDCFGTYRYANGSIYIGEWMDDKRHGQGMYTMPNGERFIGNYRDDVRKGHGTYTFPNGEKYVGEYSDDARNGHGTWTSPSGEKYVGEFRDGKRHGRGAVILPTGETYIGDIKNGLYDGQGTFTFPDGAKYAGEWSAGKRNGQGTFTLSSGAKHVGGWRDDKRHGEGILYNENGIIVESGTWNNGELIRPSNVTLPAPPIGEPNTPGSVAAPPAAPQASSGSGFRIAIGQFVTNHHVVDGCSALKVEGNSSVRVVASDQTRDLALVSMANDQGEIANIRMTRPQLNEGVTAAGFPLDGLFSGISVTNGTISRLSGLQGDTGMLQISAPVQPGNSGGPLLDAAGNVIGVVSSRLDALKMVGAGGGIPQNVNFAINGSSLRAFLDAKNINYKEVGNERELTGVQIAARASAFTVLIECQR